MYSLYLQLVRYVKINAASGAAILNLATLMQEAPILADTYPFPSSSDIVRFSNIDIDERGPNFFPKKFPEIRVSSGSGEH